MLSKSAYKRGQVERTNIIGFFFFFFLLFSGVNPWNFKVLKEVIQLDLKRMP